jgi:protoporphyrinogen oxidase
LEWARNFDEVSVMNIGVIGGGTMGLTVGYRLAKAGHRVTVFEAAPQLGGLATWFDYGDFVWDKYYHVILRSDDSLLGLFEELGIGEKMRWSNTKTGFLWRGRHLSMSNNWEFLKFPVLSLLDKARLAAGILRVQKIEDPAPLEKIRVTDWLKGIFGARVYEAIWEPLLESKYGVMKDEMPATIMWATIRRYYSTRSKRGGKETMGYLSGGFRTFYLAASRAIHALGGSVLCGSPIVSIDDADPGRVLVHTPRSKYVFDRLVSTLSTGLMRKLAPQIVGLYPRESVKPRFLGVICLALVLRKPLSPFYVTNLIQRGFPFTGVIGVSSLTGPQELEGNHLVMLPRYDLPDSAWFQKSSDEIAAEFIAGLRTVYPDIDENTVRFYLHREKLVQAIWVDAPPAAFTPMQSAQGTVWCVNAELAGRDTLNNNAIVRVADAASREFLKSLEDPRTVPPERVPPITGYAASAATS